MIPYEGQKVTFEITVTAESFTECCLDAAAEVEEVIGEVSPPCELDVELNITKLKVMKRPSRPKLYQCSFNVNLKKASEN